MTDPLNFHDRARDAKRRERGLPSLWGKRPQKARDAEAVRKYYRRWVALGFPGHPRAFRHCRQCHTRFPVYITDEGMLCEDCRRRRLGLAPLKLGKATDE